MDDNNSGSYTEIASSVFSTSYTKTGLNEGQSYKFRLRSRNSVGYSTYSSPFTIVAATKPDVPTSFLRNESSTTKTQVAFSWNAPSDNGGSSVIDYAIEMDSNNSGSYTEVSTSITGTSYTKTGLSEGTSYNFRLRARNTVNYSDYSSVFTIIAATIPSKPSNPSLAVSGDETEIVISWSLPSDLGGLAIGGYKLEIKASSGTFETDLANCNAESDSTIISSRTCSVPVSVLRANPFDLGDSSTIFARVTAINDIGSSIASSSGIATMPIAPVKPDPPTTFTGIPS